MGIAFTFVLLMIFSYLLGGVPFGLLLGRFFADVDIREHGSGNIGATNMNRVLGRKLGAATLLCDVAKAAVPVLLAKLFSYPDLHASLVGLAAIVGHCFPIYLKFRGGKGVATTFGVILCISPLIGAVTLGVWLLGYRLSRVSAVGALSSSMITPVLFYLLNGWKTALVFFVVSLIIFFRHRENIKQLRKTTPLNH